MSRKGHESTVHEAAQAWRSAGFSVLPIKADGSKSPATAKWKPYQEKAADSERVERWFNNGSVRQGLGVVTGFGELELLEFETADAYAEFTSRADAAGLGKLLGRVASGYSERSPRGGVHLFYRCEAVAGNVKLARRPGPVDPGTGKPTVEVLAETRGVGGFAVVAPSHGKVHPSGKPYERLAGEPATVTRITADERAALFAVARTMDEMPPPAPRTGASEGAGGDRPGDD
jgi:hypothetical protein